MPISGAKCLQPIVSFMLIFLLAASFVSAVAATLSFWDSDASYDHIHHRLLAYTSQHALFAVPTTIAEVGASTGSPTFRSTPDLDKPNASCDHLQRPFLRYTADYVLSPAIVLFLGKPGNVYTSRSRTKFPTQRSNMETLITFKAGQCDFDVGTSPNSSPMHAPLSLRRPVDANSDPRSAPPHPASLQSKPQVTSTSMKKTSLSISAGGLDPPQVQTLSSTS